MMFVELGVEGCNWQLGVVLGDSQDTNELDCYQEMKYPNSLRIICA